MAIRLVMARTVIRDRLNEWFPDEPGEVDILLGEIMHALEDAAGEGPTYLARKRTDDRKEYFKLYFRQRRAEARKQEIARARAK